jgi:hypothetical protein
MAAHAAFSPPRNLAFSKSPVNDVEAESFGTIGSGRIKAFASAFGQFLETSSESLTNHWILK